MYVVKLGRIPTTKVICISSRISLSDSCTSATTDLDTIVYHYVLALNELYIKIQTSYKSNSMQYIYTDLYIGLASQNNLSQWVMFGKLPKF